MNDCLKSLNELPLEASIPTGACPLASILCTEELSRRRSRPAEFEKENRALTALVSALADSPQTILQTLADKVLEVLNADSAGLSLLTKDEKRFYWAAIAGAWSPHIGGGTPREFGPCGDVLDRCTPMLFTHWERRYPYLSSALPLAEEGLLVPFYVNGKAVGTIWAIAHDERRRFDAEDLRLLESMGYFASPAYQAVESIESLRSEISARERAEIALHELNNELETRVRVRTEELEERNREVKASQEALRKAETDLAHATRVMTMGEMVSSISHEINQPLGSISNYGNAARRLLAAEPKGLQEVDHALANIVSEAERASAVISRIRGLSRKSQTERVPLRIEEVIGEVLALSNRELLSRNIVARSEIAADLPLIRGDRIELEQVLLNLVTNGADAISVSSGSRALLVSAERCAQEPHGFVRVSVRDSGGGLRPEELERIFTPFYTTKPAGMGLGLAISRTIVKAHGGRLWAEINDDGPGATFHFTLPTAA